MKSLIAFLFAPVQNPIAYWFKNTFAPIMPRKWKRALYVFSIIAMTSYHDKPNFVLFQQINDLLKLSYKPNAYWIPKFVRNMIWQSVINQKIPLHKKTVQVASLDSMCISSEELGRVCFFLADRAPEWLIYAPEPILAADAMKCLSVLFENKFEQFHTPQGLVTAS